MYHDATNFDQFSGALLLDATERSNDGLSPFHWGENYRDTHQKYHARLECVVDTLDQDQYWSLLDAILCKLLGERGDSALHSHLEDLSRVFWYFCHWWVLRSVVHFKIYENHNIASSSTDPYYANRHTVRAIIPLSIVTWWLMDILTWWPIRGHEDESKDMMTNQRTW